MLRTIERREVSYGDGVRGLRRTGKRGLRILSQAIQVLRDSNIKRAKETSLVSFYKLDKSTPEASKAAAKYFHNAIADARANNIRGEYVYLYPEQTTQDEIGYDSPDMELFLNEEGTIGYAIHKTAIGNDLVSVFSSGKKTGQVNSVYSILFDAIANGANKLDCYGDGLLARYMAVGFKAIAKIAFNMDYASEAWKDNVETLGTPPVYIMYLADTNMELTVDSLETRLSIVNDDSRLKEMINSIPETDDYDDAMNNRDKILKDQQVELKEAPVPVPEEYYESADYYPFTGSQISTYIKNNKSIIHAPVKAGMETLKASDAEKRTKTEKENGKLSYKQSEMGYNFIQKQNLGLPKINEGQTYYDYMEQVVLPWVKDNLRGWIKRTSFESARKSLLWYPRGRMYAEDIAKRTGLSVPQVGYIIGALSPNFEWNLNMELAEFIIEKLLSNATFTLEEAETKFINKNLNKTDEAIVFTIESMKRLHDIPLRELSYEDQAIALACMTKLDRRAVRLTDNYLQYDGFTKSKLQTGRGYLPLEAAIAVFYGGNSIEALNKVSKQLKVRSFSNDLTNPASARGEVTIDTHAIAAALNLPIGGKTKLDGSHAIASSIFDASGQNMAISMVIQEAYTQLAEEYSILPHQMQALIWVTCQQAFVNQKKDNMIGPALEILRGEGSLEEKRERLLDYYCGENTVEGITPESFKLQTVPEEDFERIYDGVEFKDVNDKARIKQIACLCMRVAEHTKNHGYQDGIGNLVNSLKSLISDSEDNALNSQTSETEIADQVSSDMIDAYVQKKGEGLNLFDDEQFDKMVELEKQRASQYPKLNLHVRDTDDIVAKLRAQARLAEDFANFVGLANALYGTDDEPLSYSDLEQIYNQVKETKGTDGLEKNKSTEGATLANPNLAIEDSYEKAEQFLDILSDKESFEEFLRALANRVAKDVNSPEAKAIKEAVSPFVWNLITKLNSDQETVLTKEGYRIAFGQVQQNALKYIMSLYGQYAEGANC